MPEVESCPICNAAVKRVTFNGYEKKEGSCYQCAVCGPYFISRKAEVSREGYNLDHRIPAWIREHEIYERPIPELTMNLLDDLLRNLPKYNAGQKQIKLLQAIERQTDYPGDKVPIND